MQTWKHLDNAKCEPFSFAACSPRWWAFVIMHERWAKPEVPLHEQSRTRSSPDSFDPSSRHSQQHGASSGWPAAAALSVVDILNGRTARLGVCICHLLAEQKSITSLLILLEESVWVWWEMRKNLRRDIPIPTFEGKADDGRTSPFLLPHRPRTLWRSCLVGNV